MKSLCRFVLPLAALLIAPWAHAEEFVLESPDIRDGGSIDPPFVYNALGCKGSNSSPLLSWKHPPEGTRSFAITVRDIDAPAGNDWWNWLVVNLPLSTEQLEHRASSARLPAGALEIGNVYGKIGYGGPCPPAGKAHRYEFTVWALKTDKLKIDAKAGGTLAAFIIRQNALGQAKITASYGR